MNNKYAAYPLVGDITEWLFVSKRHDNFGKIMSCKRKSAFPGTMDEAGLRLPVEDVFILAEVAIPEIYYAPMVASVTCFICVESIMENRPSFVNQDPACRSCASQEYWMVIGRGIHPVCGGK